MKTQALAEIPETKRADGQAVRLSDVVKVSSPAVLACSRSSRRSTGLLPSPKLPGGVTQMTIPVCFASLLALRCLLARFVDCRLL